MTALNLNNPVPGDHTIFDAINTFARHTVWLHSPTLAYATYGVVLFAGLLLVGWWVARSTGNHTQVAAALLTPLGAMLAIAINQPIVNAVREARPYTALPNILVLATGAPTTPSRATTRSWRALLPAASSSSTDASASWRRLPHC